VLAPRRTEAQEGSFEPGQEGWAMWTPDAALILSND
jgi:hypothetical protein